MRRFGVTVTREGDTFVVPPGGYRAADYAIEPDASTASYFFAAAALTGRTATVPGLGAGALQGDLQFVDLVRHVQREVERDGPDQSSHDPARITFCTAYSSSSRTRSARFPVSIEPTSYQPKVCAGVVDAIRDASTSETPDFTALR